MKSQVNAVIEGVQKLKGQEAFTERVELTGEERAKLADWIVEGIESGEVAFSDRARAKYDTPAKVRSYVLGMISNHLRKCPKLNGGEAYRPRNPGSRAGSTDPVVRELRKLMRVAPEEHRELIQAELDKRLEELRREKLKTVEIDEDLLPESLRGII